jgi:predicted metal-binding membrane protein
MTSTERLNRPGLARWIIPVAAAGAAIGTLIVAYRMGNGPGAMGLDLATFVGLWTLMMAAMMLPSITSITAADTGGQRPPGARDISAFVVGYLIVWVTAGIAAFPLALLAGRLADRPVADATAAAVTLCAICALYQLSPLKRRCLTRCRNTRLRLSGADLHPAGALRRGVTHGRWCLACNWASVLLLIVFGLMNVAAMTIVAILICAEKHRSRAMGPRLLAGAASAVCAVVILVHPPLASGLHHTPMTAMNCCASSARVS